MKVIPPNFGYVEDGVFRCGAPEPRHYGFLASLGLRTCILLTDTHDAAFVHWLQETGVMIFCPLSNEAQTRGTVRTAPNVYNTVHVSDNMGFPPTRSSAGGGGGLPSTSSVHTNNNNHTNDGREDVASPNGGQGETYGSTIGSGGFGPVGDAPHPAAHQHSNEGNDGGGDNGEGGVDNSGNFNGDDIHASATHPNINLSIGGGARGGAGWVNSSTTTGATPGTSNAVRFLQENVVERQMNTKFSPVLVQEPVYFPGGSRTDNGRGGHGGGGGGGTTSSGGGGGPYQFVSAPSYEGRLHGLMTLSEAVVVSILHILLDPQYYPLLITCSKGRYRSGIVCGCLRKLQGWNLVSILEEYRRFAGNKSRADNEEFIELFDEDLVNLELADGRRPTILYNM